METFFGYLRTIRQYIETPKGRHDTLDYLKAVILILITIMAVYLFFGILPMNLG